MNPHVDGVPHEWVAALENPYTMQNIPPDTSAAPGTSTRGRRPGTSRCSSTAAPVPAAAANSTFRALRGRAGCTWLAHEVKVTCGRVSAHRTIRGIDPARRGFSRGADGTGR